MGNTLALCVGGRSRGSGTDYEVPMHANHNGPSNRNERQKSSASADGSVHRIEDGYEDRMQIDDEELAARYRHCMQTTGRATRRRSSGTARRRPSRVVTFRAESFDSQASTESEKINFINLLIDSLPETFLDDDSGANGLTDSTKIRVAAQVNHYDADDDTEDYEVFAGTRFSTQQPQEATVANDAAMLSESIQSHTYESIKSIEDAAAGDATSSSPPTPPPPPPPPPPQLKKRKKSSTPKSKQSSRRVQQTNGVDEKIDLPLNQL